MRARPDLRRNAAIATSRRNDSGSVFVALLAALALSCFATLASAQDDLPGRVGRIADLAGQLYLSSEERAADWMTIGLNYPVASGDNLWVSGDGRAEVDYGGGQFRLAGDTNLHVSRLDENQIALFVAQGRLIVRVRALDPGESARIDVPNTQIELMRPGLYRIDVDPDRQASRVTVREGEVQVATTVGVQQALPGQIVVIRGPDASAVEVINGTGQDGFDAWSATRDRYYERARSTAYVSRQMVGAADLDNYGVWETTPEYGSVWYPGDVAPDWAPYRFGYWTTVGAFGYTWVDYAPWGYAPFHYGRWVYVGRRWGWCPGAYVARPIWAPALVAWVGGPGWGFSTSVGGPVYGWVPLAWGEPYRPWWGGCAYNCWARYNRPYDVNVTVNYYNTYRNAPPPHYRNIGAPNAVTVVNAATLAGHVPVASNAVRVPPQQLSRAPVLAKAPALPGAPLHVPVVRAGSGGTPEPASTFYPVARQRGATLPARIAVPAPSTTAAPPADNTVRRTSPPARSTPPPPGAPTTAAPSRQAAPGSVPPRSAVMPDSGNAGAPPPTRVERSAPRPVSPPAGVSPGTGQPQPSAPPMTRTPPQRTMPTERGAHVSPPAGISPGTGQPQSSTAPAVRMPPQRSAPAERAAPGAPQAARPAPAVAPPPAPVAPGTTATRSGGQPPAHAAGHEEARPHLQPQQPRDPNAPPAKP